MFAQRVVLFVTPVLATLLSGAAEPAVRVLRLPNGCVQPRVVQSEVQGKNVVQAVYLSGDASHSDVMHGVLRENGQAIEQRQRVNGTAGNALAIGTVRGAGLTVDSAGRAHVCWIGPSAAKDSAKGLAVLYSHQLAAGKSFEAEQDLSGGQQGIDGGAAVAAEDRDRIAVVWHAPADGQAGEQGRRVFAARSLDCGQTFQPAELLIDDSRGGCACCGLQTHSIDTELLTLYRCADQKTHRDVLLARTTDENPIAKNSAVTRVDRLEADTCVMSTFAIEKCSGGALLAWEGEDRIHLARYSAKDGAVRELETTARGIAFKHPALAINGDGRIALAWTEGTGWNRGGSVAWQVLDCEGREIAGATGRKGDLPVWGAPAVAPLASGGFVILY